MVRKFETAERHLDRTLWKLRDQLSGKERRREMMRH
jgi:hypothetical protein